jgi:hypothetical protein
VVGSCEHGNEPSGFMRGRHLLKYQLLKKDSVPWTCADG